MVDSKEFAEGIFDALARRRRQSLERITKEELYDFWLQISDQSFDARLQIFFDMYDCISESEFSADRHCEFPRTVLTSPRLLMRFFFFFCPEFRVDTNVDGRITREEVQEVTSLLKHLLTKVSTPPLTLEEASCGRTVETTVTSWDL
jgi:hypothetical protein